MIPKYPLFKKIDFKDLNEINKITKKNLPYSDFNFSVLWSYNTKKDLKLSLLNGNLIVRFTDALDLKPYYSFYGGNKFEETSLTLLKLTKTKKDNSLLKYIPEIFAKNQKTNRIVIKESRDNFDYVFSVDKLSSLKGHDLEKKRWRFSKFCRTYQNHQVRLLDLKDKTVHSMILIFFKNWALNKNKSSKETINEFKAIKNLFDLADKLEFICLGIFDKNKLIAFSINEKLRNKYALGHFAKTNPLFFGVHEALYKYSADSLKKKGCVLFNMEEDMGLENLRAAKMSWRPDFFLKKFNITLNN
ncbi:DUF2156 domain-containing protein [Candidatus Roizmanbacteria bacterium]|nr:DUF2156 domain-containing protein [Candidatus Roizmanbacteria bacterium]